MSDAKLPSVIFEALRWITFLLTIIAAAQVGQCAMQYRSEQRAEAVRAEIMRQVPAEPSERGL